jgi:acetylornithine deacetylase/succinyl-diaminopimelate desuccinylase-like protein
MMTDLISRLLDLAIAIQQIPAPTFHEQERAEFVRDQFLKEELQDVEMDATGNVYARLPGSSTSLRAAPFDAAPRPGRQGRQGKPLFVSAHLDTVFPANIELHVFREGGRVSGPGIGDNAIGAAGLLGLVWALRERSTRLTGDLWLVANVCEEGLGGLRGMKAVVDRFGDEPRAYIVLEGLALGQVYHRALGVRRYHIAVKTAGGHSWVDYGCPSAVHELIRLASELAALRLPTTPRTTLNIGKISGGISVNTIAPEAALELDLRSEGSNTLLDLARQVEGLARNVERAGVAVEVIAIGERPVGGIAADHPLVRLAQECLRAQGIAPNLNIGSTDANVPLSRGIPAITIGLTTGSGAHTVHEYINVEPLKKGMEQLVKLVSSIQ